MRRLLALLACLAGVALAPSGAAATVVYATDYTRLGTATDAGGAKRSLGVRGWGAEVSPDGRLVEAARIRDRVRHGDAAHVEVEVTTIRADGPDSTMAIAVGATSPRDRGRGAAGRRRRGRPGSLAQRDRDDVDGGVVGPDICVSQLDAPKAHVIAAWIDDLVVLEADVRVVPVF